MYIDADNLAEMFPMFITISVVVAVIIFVAYHYVTIQDNRKELITKKVKVLEKPVQQGNIEWYVMECETGERLKLRSFQANRIMIAVGDVGIVSYRGQTIQEFRREK